MVIGVSKEIKIKENRVGMTPAGVGKLTKLGHKIFVEKNAGVGSGFADKEYQKAGAQILNSGREVYKKSQMIVKIKEPQEKEFAYFRPGLIIFTYLHLAAERKLTLKLLAEKITGIAYETVEKNGKLPLLSPMSQVAGRMATQVGAHYLEKSQGGKGVLLGGVEGVKPGKVVILGYGSVSRNACQMARGLGAEVLVITRDSLDVRRINNQKNPLFHAVISTPKNITQALKSADLLISGVLVPGACAPKIITKKMIKNMQPGSVFVDVAIDQGGSSETSHPTSHLKPTYLVDGVIHYCVTNMPGAVPHTSTLAITNATLPYIIKLAKGGIKAVKKDQDFAKGVNTYQGHLTYQAVAQAFGMKHVPLEEISNF